MFAVNKNINMIKHLLISGFAFASVFATAQQLNNSGFENWSAGNPNGWGSFDAMYTAAGLPGTNLESQVSPGHSGLYACELKTQSLGTGTGAAPGVINSGTISFDLATSNLKIEGVPYTLTPSAYSFYYKYAPVGGDTALSFAFFTKWNSITGSRDTVGFGGSLISGTTSSFTMMTLPITWLGLATPDSIQMRFISSVGDTNHANTSLIIDDINMIFPTGLNEQFSGAYNVFPNPAVGVLNIVSNDNQASRVEIYDFTGKMFAGENFEGNKVQINTENIPAGMYIYRILDVQGKELKTNKFSVAK